MSCSHVVASAQGRSVQIGDQVFIITNDNSRVPVSVVKIGDPVLDLCVMERTEAASFPIGSTALWAGGRPGQPFTGLGMNKDYAGGVSLSGTLGAYGMGEQFQIIAADGTDNRVEQGCSGAPIFEKSLSDGPLLGMVTSYQQKASGRIIPAKTLAAFWPSLRAFDADPGEAMPAMLEDGTDALLVDRLLREIDREPQRRLFQDAVDRRRLLAKHGFLITMLPGLWADLPERCASALRDYAFALIMGQTAPDTLKPLVMAKKIGGLLSGTESGASYNLLSALSWRYKIGTSIADVRQRLTEETVPLTILATATVADLPLITPQVVQGWAKCLAKLTIPESRKPLLMFIMVVSDDDQAAGATPARTVIVSKPWYVGLPELTPIKLNEVRTWALELPSDPPGRRARTQIERILDARGAGSASFRLKELESWFSVT